MLLEGQSEESAIESIKGLISDDNYNIGQSEDTQAKPEGAAEPKQETGINELKETAKADAPVEIKTDPAAPEEDEEIEIKGEKYKVPKAIKESIMLQADYTKKTMALADERKALEAQKGQIDPNLTQKLTHYENLLGDAVRADQQTDWQKLLHEDPIGYLQQKELAEARQREWQQVNVKNQKEIAEKVSQVANKEWEQLTAKRPELKEAAAFKAHDEKIKTFLTEQGYEPREVGPALMDHRVRLMVEDAIKYRDLQTASAETAKKIEKLPPKIERPGVPSGTDSQGSNKSAMQKLKGSGKVDDAADAIRALMGQAHYCKSNKYGSPRAAFFIGVYTMTAVTNTFITTNAKGIREDLSDIIYNIAPTDTPFMSGIKKGKAANTFFEWQTDTLASAANNKVNEGNDVSSGTATAVTATVRIGNYCQISQKDGIISGTQRAVKTAGRKDEFAYQVAKRGKEIKRDMEFALTQNGTYSSTDPRQTRGLAGWCATNCLVGAGAGAAPVAGATNTAPVAGTSRAFTESLLKTNLQSIWNAGGSPSMLMVGGSLKQTVSTFTGNATRMNEAEGEALYAAVDVYYSDFGKLKVVPNRFQETTTAFQLDLDYWKLNYLRPFNTYDLAKTGDADRFMLNVEYGLESDQEAASGQIRDIA